MAIYKRIHRALGRPIGASAVEYLVAMILVILVVLATVRVFGDTVKSRFGAGSDTISTMDKEKNPNAAGASGKGAAAASGGGSSESSGKGGGSAATTYRTEEERQQALIAKEAKKNQKAKFNPLILLVFVGLIGLLFFVVFRGNSYN